MTGDEGVEALGLVREATGVALDGTYSAKGFSAVVKDAREGLLKDKTVLFWNTYNSVDVWDQIEGADYHALPGAFHRYFEGDVQALDQ